MCSVQCVVYQFSEQCSSRQDLGVDTALAVLGDDNEEAAAVVAAMEGSRQGKVEGFSDGQANLPDGQYVLKGTGKPDLFANFV